jgi:hypothetical protein
VATRSQVMTRPELRAYGMWIRNFGPYSQTRSNYAHVCARSREVMHHVAMAIKRVVEESSVSELEA